MTEPTSSIEALIREERFADAGRLLDEQPEATPALALWRARLDVARGEHAADEVILRLEALIAAGGLDDDATGQAFELLASCYVRKRLPELAREVIARGREASGDRVGFHALEAEVALVEDDRPAAREAYERALSRDPDHGAARLGYGQLLYVMADFDAAEAELSRVPIRSRHYGAAQRTRAASAAARGDHEGAVARWRGLIEARPRSEHTQSDRIHLGLSLAAFDRQEAREVLHAAWQLAPESGPGRYARERLTHLEAADPELRRVELEAFPTTAQKWNYCGPAVLELVLRYFDFEASQDAIAHIVKREQGTPMYEIVAYLSQMGVEARRVEVNAERIKRAIDLGCPVIVQEEYSSSSHVAVISGYDDALGVFVMQDPMRHEPMLKSFSFTEAAGDLFGNGAVVVLGPTERAERLRGACDEAGLVAQRHLALVDECSRRRRAVQGDGQERLSPSEIIRYCDEARALAPDFKLARHLRFWAMRDLERAGALEPDAVTRELAVLRVRYPYDEWPHQLQGVLLLDRGLYDEAFVAFLDAHRRDPHDENNLQSMGEARWLAGDLASAETYLLRALRERADCVRASESLAALYLRELEERASTDPDGEQAESVEARMPPKALRTRLSHAPDALVERARHFSRVALAAAPETAFNSMVAGELAFRLGDLPGAKAALERSLELDPRRDAVRRSLASVLEALGETSAAEAALRRSVEQSMDRSEPYVALAALLRRSERHAEAAEVLEGALAEVRDRPPIARPLYSVLEHLGTGESAAAQLRALAERYLGDYAFLREVVTTLDDEWQRGHALALARHVVELTPNDVGAVWQLARLLDASGVHREEARAAYERVLELAPSATVARVRLAWLVIPEEPERALSLLEPSLAEEDSAVYDAQAAALESLGQHEEAERALSRAIRSAPSEPVGLALLISRHTHATDRYARAHQLARRIDLDALDKLPRNEREYVEQMWLTAHRLAGRAPEVLERARAMASSGVPKHLAWEMYYAFRSFDRELAARAAEVKAQSCESAEVRVEWELTAAGLRAKHTGDASALEVRAKNLPAHAEAWAELHYAYALLDRYAEADEAAARAFELDPLSPHAFTAWIHTLERQNRIDEAIACAEAFAASRPYEHQGPERLGIILAKIGRVDEALVHAERAMDAAPYCHISQQSLALALFMSGDREGALEYARRAAGTEPPAPDDTGESDSALLIAALTGDRAALERGLAALEASEPGVYPLYRERLLEAVTAQP